MSERASLCAALREADEVLVKVGALDQARAVRNAVAALREIGTPRSVPEHFDPLDWWRYTASKRGEIARDALGVTVEELILDGE